MAATTTLGLATALCIVQTRPVPTPQLDADLQWDAPQACPDAAFVRERVETLLGWRWDSTQIRVFATVQPVGDGWRLHLDFGAVSPATGGLRLAVGLGWRVLRLELLGAYWFARRVELQPGAGADVSLATAELRGCGRIKFAPVEFPLCLGLEAGAHRSRGFGLVNDPQDDEFNYWVYLRRDLLRDD